jgi:hypothetical protein
MKRMVGLVSLVVVAGSLSVARADAPSPFDVRTVPAAQTPSALAPEPEPATGDVVIEHGARQRRAALWTGAAGATLVAGSLAVSFVAMKRFDAAVARGDVDAANDAQSIARNVGTSMFLAGAAAAGVAAVLYISAPRLRERRVIVAPAAGSDQLGLAITGGF